MDGHFDPSQTVLSAVSDFVLKPVFLVVRAKDFLPTVADELATLPAKHV